MSGFEVEGLDELQKKLEKLIKKTNEIPPEQDVPMSELFDTGFLTQRTRFSTIDELFESAGINIESAEDFKNMPKDKLDKFIRENTSFSSYDEMFGEAGTAYCAKQLDL